MVLSLPSLEVSLTVDIAIVFITSAETIMQYEVKLSVRRSLGIQPCCHPACHDECGPWSCSGVLSRKLR
ncbi:hypothetical protein TcWFU_009590 [Taenia crassiceps]|uniref:Uncharacterized protein n=1 Tax=Taenia crassiceps TaxID=6207 RepID=A0ABR4QNK0_9CEST